MATRDDWDARVVDTARRICHYIQVYRGRQAALAIYRQFTGGIGGNSLQEAGIELECDPAVEWDDRQRIEKLNWRMERLLTKKDRDDDWDDGGPPSIGVRPI